MRIGTVPIRAARRVGISTRSIAVLRNRLLMRAAQIENTLEPGCFLTPSSAWKSARVRRTQRSDRMAPARRAYATGRCKTRATGSLCGAMMGEDGDMGMMLPDDRLPKSNLVQDESMTAVLDVRSTEAFCRLHRGRAVNVPLEELAQRIHEMPPPEQPIIVFDDNAERASVAAEILRARGRIVAEVVTDRDWLRAGPTETGPSTAALWRPHALLEEALRISASTWPGNAGRTALDLACGSGRDAVFLARAGFDTHAWDVLPDALARCDALAARYGATVTTRCVDLRKLSADPPDSAFDLVCCFDFLQRPLMPFIREAVRPGGFVVYETFVEPQRQRYGRPGGAAHVLAPGELASYFSGWHTEISREGPSRPRRVTAALVARKPT